MKIPELRPLLEKIAVLEGNQSTMEVLHFVQSRVNNANTPSMAQSACEAIATMCSPKAWGDLNVQDFGAGWPDWLKFLEELRALAITCAQATYEGHSKQ